MREAVFAFAYNGLPHSTTTHSTSPGMVEARASMVGGCALDATAAGRCRLSAQPQLLDQCPVSIGLGPPQVVQEASALAHQLEQPTARVMVLSVDLEVRREAVDPLGQERHLHFGRPGIGFMDAVRVDGRSFVRAGDQVMSSFDAPLGALERSGGYGPQTP